MLSLFCVVLRVVAQPSNSPMHAAVTLLRKIHLNGFMFCCLVILLIGRDEVIPTVLKINSTLDERAVQFVLIRETGVPVVVF